MAVHVWWGRSGVEEVKVFCLELFKKGFFDGEREKNPCTVKIQMTKLQQLPNFKTLENGKKKYSNSKYNNKDLQ